MQGENSFPCLFQFLETTLQFMNIAPYTSEPATKHQILSCCCHSLTIIRKCSPLLSRSVVSDSLWPHGLYSPWSSPGQNIGVGSSSLLQGIFPTQGSKLGLSYCSRFFINWATREAISKNLWLDWAHWVIQGYISVSRSITFMSLQSFLLPYQEAQSHVPGLGWGHIWGNYSTYNTSQCTTTTTYGLEFDLLDQIYLASEIKVIPTLESHQERKEKKTTTVNQGITGNKRKYLLCAKYIKKSA